MRRGLVMLVVAVLALPVAPPAVADPTVTPPGAPTDVVADVTDPSIAVTATATLPGYPTDAYAAHDGPDGAYVTWHRPADTGGKRITGYLVEADPDYQPGAAQPPAQTVDGDTLNATFTGLTSGATYGFSIRAINVLGTGQPTYANSVTPGGVPTPPVDAVATATAYNSATVTWTPPPDADLENDPEVLGYHVMVDFPDGTHQWVDTADAAVTITGLPQGEPYEFEVAAINDSGVGDYSRPSPDIAVIDPPKPPQIVGVRVGGHRVRVQWIRSALDGGPDAIGYELSAVAGHQIVRRDVGKVNIASLFGLTDGRTYRVTVAVRYPTGTRLGSTPVTATPVGVATSGMQLRYLYFDPPGTDDHTKLNQEWVRIRNMRSTPATLQGWTITDASAHSFTFGDRVVPGNDWFDLHTGSGTSGGHDRYWHSTSFIWNNSGDTATLRNAHGTVIDRCTYTAADAPEASCI